MYDNLTLKEKAELIRLGVSNGIYSLKDIKDIYNNFANGGSIHIKPENRGKFTALKERTGHSTSWFIKNGTPAQKKMAVFANNARKWKHDEGYQTTASGDYSHAEGYNAIASGAASHAGGYVFRGSISASGAGSFAHGHVSNGSIGASSKGAVAIGCATAIGAFKSIIKASGQGAHAEGFANRGTIDASGNGAHAEGYNTAALANGAHAEGRNTTASGQYSHAEGFHTEANNQSEHASGKYNKSNNQDANAQTIFSIGIGTSKTDRKNAIEVLLDGRVYITGVGGYDGTNPFDSSSLQDFLNSLSGGGGA